MAVIPSFQSGAKQPDLAGAYLGGRRTSIAEEQMRGELALGGARIAQAAAETQNRIALGQQELQARRIQNEMELMAQRVTQERNHLRQQQEAEILRSYRETQIGMEERRLKIAEAENTRNIAEASRAFEQQQFFAKRFPQLKAQYMAEPGVTEQQASQRAAEQTTLEMGPGTAGFPSALSPPSQGAERKYSVVAGEDIRGTPIRLPMTAPEFQSWLPSAPPQLRTNTANLAIQGMLQPPASATGTNAPNEIIRRTKEGRRVVYDARTKQPIRYAD